MMFPWQLKRIADKGFDIPPIGTTKTKDRQEVRLLFIHYVHLPLKLESCLMRSQNMSDLLGNKISGMNLQC